MECLFFIEYFICRQSFLLLKCKGEKAFIGLIVNLDFTKCQSMDK